MKQYKNGTIYPEVSLFRKGIEVLISMFDGIYNFLSYLSKQIKTLWKTPDLLIVYKNIQ
jgi:hypothetical protein